MSIEEIIRAWKADEEAWEPHLPTSPVGRELSENELIEVVGGVTVTFPATCICTNRTISCVNTDLTTINI